jgi:ketosteroid isomerase-like protein
MAKTSYRKALALGLIVGVGTLSAPLSAASVEDTLKKLENDWAHASATKDVKTISAIVADDWISQSDSGQQTTKKELIDGILSGDTVVTEQINGPMTVRVFGDVGLVQGSDDEKSSYKGIESSGKYTWLDIFVKRNGKWLLVASQSTRVTP